MLSVPRIEGALQSYRYRPASSARRWAAVAAVLRPGTSGAEVLVIRRSENPDDPWSGHMAMPGGRQDPGDPSVQFAAERETREEVGIDLTRSGRLLGRLDDVTAVAKGRQTGLVIAPFVYALEEPVDPIPNHEVQEAVWVPLGDLESGDYRSTRPYQFGPTRLLLPCWDWNGRVIWGLTYNMLDTLLRVTVAP